MPFHIDEIFAFLATEADGEEGVIGWHIPNHGWMPLVAADVKRVESLRPIAQEVANATGRRITLARFHLRQDVETLTAEGGPK